ncbi:hypothetical protein [Flavihumibacter solisilvae]|uniref:Pectate lyase superfamily protein domain-containing protein n=1 Tax=Flavihumibacter solisilvae TaxID=1349421 RepID=A0A0C1L0P2_9BACT|nr:hypothetical protein [Flavihumibacter solisilvae]KIC93567.1 hypothetical protein OI18_17700 [Flavihumibacter solisilvae]
MSWLHLLLVLCWFRASNEITLESFGVKGNGTDETAMILKALAAAREKKLPLRLLGKTYVFSPTQTIDITGIPAFTGKGRFDLSRTGTAIGNKAMKAVFQVSGKIQMVQSGIREIKAGDTQLRLTSGLSLKPGDVMFLTSAEPLANTRRAYYNKGQRLIVKSYEKQTGLLSVAEPVNYSFNSACLWINNLIPEFSVDKDIEFVTAPMNFITCLRIYYAKARISGRYTNFALTAVMFKSSSGTVQEMQAELPVSSNNGYSHCIQVADMSDVAISNCRLSGGRHVISGTAGGLWEQNSCGGNGHAGYPSRLTIDGGEYKGTFGVADITADIGTLDAHGVVQEMVIRNCTVYGGINLGANRMIVENVTIYPNGKYAFNVGSDVEPGSEWGQYSLQNITVRLKDTDPAVFSSKADIMRLTIRGMKVEGFGRNNLLIDFRKQAPKEVDVSDLQGRGIDQPDIIRLLKRTKWRVTNSSLGKGSVRQS